MTRIVVVGVGGQGVLFASKVLAQAAMSEGHDAVMSEVHGMAQRGGVVVTNLCIGCIQSSLIGATEADIIFAFEPIEAYRQIALAHPETRIVTNTAPIVPVAVSIGKAKYPNLDDLFGKIREITPKLTAIDADKMATEAGSYLAVNTVQQGALAGPADCPVSKDSMVAALKENVPPKMLEVNLKAFELGFNSASE